MREFVVPGGRWLRIEIMIMCFYLGRCVIRNMRTVKERTTARLSSRFCWATLLSTVRFIIVPGQILLQESLFISSRTFLVFKSRFEPVYTAIDVEIHDDQADDWDYSCKNSCNLTWLIVNRNSKWKQSFKLDLNLDAQISMR